LSEDTGYVLYSAFGSFYIPSCIMVFVYIKIYFAVRKRARRHFSKQKEDKKTACLKDDDPSKHWTKPKKVFKMHVITESKMVLYDEPSKTCHNGVLINNKDDMENTEVASMSDVNDEDDDLSGEKMGHTKLSSTKNVEKNAKNNIIKNVLLTPLMSKRFKQNDDTTDGEMFDQHITAAERQKKINARNKERRATLIVGLIMGSFIACWFPFFFLYSLSPLCPICETNPESRYCVPSWGFQFAFWLGYSNSALNPIIYTVFNKDFRTAFAKILFHSK